MYEEIQVHPNAISGKKNNNDKIGSMLSNKNHGFVVKNNSLPTNGVGFGDCSLNPQAVNIPSDIWSEWNKYKLHKLGIIQETRGSLGPFLFVITPEDLITCSFYSHFVLASTPQKVQKEKLTCCI